MAGGHKDAVFAQRETGNAVRGVVVNHALERWRNGQPAGQPPCQSCVQSTRRPENQRPFVATVNSTGAFPLIQHPTGLAPSGTQSADLKRLYMSELSGLSLHL